MATVFYPPQDIALDPSDWYIANWRNLPPLPRGEKAFDQDECCKRLAAVKVSRGIWDWQRARIGPCLSPEEGRFWLDAFEGATHPKASPETLAHNLAKQKSFKPLPDTYCKSRVKSLKPSVAAKLPEFVPALASQIDLPTFAELMLDTWKPQSRRSSWHPPIEQALNANLLTGFRRFVRPWLTEEEMVPARLVIRDALLKLNNPDSEFYHTLALAASLGMSREVEGHVAEFTEVSPFGPAVPDRPFAIFGLANREQVLHEFRRLKIRLFQPDQVRGLLAHLEGEALEPIRDNILLAANRQEAEQLTVCLGLVLRSQTAPIMLQLLLQSRGPGPAQRWLDEHKELAIPALLQVVDDPKLSEPAQNYLQQQVRAGHQGLIDIHLERLDPALAAIAQRGLATTRAMQKVDELGVPLWFPQPGKRRFRLPSWLDLAGLPPLRVEGKRLPMEQVTTLLVLLRESPLTSPHPVFAQIKKQSEPRLLDAFAWAVFERWHSASSDPKDKWALTTLGLLGGDGVCLPLTALILEWPTRSQSLRASHGVECLQGIGTPLAWLCIRRIAQQSHHAVGMDARSCFTREAKRRKLSEEDLDDLIVPDLGLDRHGYRKLDYAGHACRLTLGRDRLARLLDDRHQYLSEFPELGEGDDPMEAEAARAEWNTYRRQVQEVMRIQTERLHLAMWYWRRWRGADFLAHLARHPLLGRLCNALVWGVFETINKPRYAFRLQGGECLDVAGSPVPLEANDQVGVLHPVLLSADERLVWRDLMAELDEELPEWQLTRPIHELHAQEKNLQELSRWRGTFLDYYTMYRETSSRSFESGAHQRNATCARVRYVPQLNLTVYLVHTPIPEVMRFEEIQAAPVEILGIQFRPGDTRTRVPNVNDCVTLGEVDLVLIDYVIGEVNEIVAKSIRPT